MAYPLQARLYLTFPVDSFQIWPKYSGCFELQEKSTLRCTDSLDNVNVAHADAAPSSSLNFATFILF